MDRPTTSISQELSVTQDISVSKNTNPIPNSINIETNTKAYIDAVYQ
ncbi:673_t:CDS:1, partial [Racocetra persica]